MRRKRPFYRSLRRLGLGASMVAGAVLLHSCGDADPEPQADPAEVQRFLAQIEAEHQSAEGEADRKKGYEKRLRNLVEGAAIRSPSEASINKIETVVAGSLG